MLRREQNSPEAEIGLEPKVSNRYFTLTAHLFCHTGRYK